MNDMPANVTLKCKKESSTGYERIRNLDKTQSKEEKNPTKLKVFRHYPSILSWCTLGIHRYICIIVRLTQLCAIVQRNMQNWGTWSQNIN